VEQKKLKKMAELEDKAEIGSCIVSVDKLEYIHLLAIKEAAKEVVGKCICREDDPEECDYCDDKPICDAFYSYLEKE
jgi:hypothetical protein